MEMQLRPAAEGPQFIADGATQPKPKSRRISQLRATLATQRAQTGGLVLCLAVCGIALAVIVGRRTGASGLALGALLAIVPVPLVVGAFLWLGKARPQPWRDLLFTFAWGGCAGALVALLTNTWSAEMLEKSSSADTAETLGLTVVAPFIEEAAKGAAVLLLLISRRRWIRGPLDGLIPAGISAAGFAFTENILYFGRSYSDGEMSDTVTTFLVRGIMSPFAHPLFTGTFGLAVGFAVVMRGRWLPPLTVLGGYLVGVGLHSAWNGSALGGTSFLLVYILVMLPLLGGLITVSILVRKRQIRAVRQQIPLYAQGGWFAPYEAGVLASMTDRARELRVANVLLGPAGVRAARAYQWDATALAELRQRALRKEPSPTYAAEEQELLARLWAVRPFLAPVLVTTLPTPRWELLPAHAPVGR